MILSNRNHIVLVVLVLLFGATTESYAAPNDNSPQVTLGFSAFYIAPWVKSDALRTSHSAVSQRQINTVHSPIATAIAPRTDRASALFSDPATTAGVGYVWQVKKNFYLSPWAATQVLGGDIANITEYNRSPGEPVQPNPQFTLRIGVLF